MEIRDILVKEGWFVKYKSDPLVTVHVIINRTRERDAHREILARKECK